jgi:hypothetical protein
LTFLKLNQIEKGLNFLVINEKEFNLVNSKIQSQYFINRRIFAEFDDDIKQKELYLEKSIQISKTNEHYGITSSAYSNKGISSFETNYLLAKAYFDSSLYYANLAFSQKRVALAEFNLGIWHSELDDQVSALYYLDRSFKNYIARRDFAGAIEVKEEMVAIYSLLQEWERVDAMYRDIVEVKNTQYQTMQAAYAEMDEVDAVLDMQIKSVELEQKKNPTYLGRMSLILLLAGLFLLQSLLILLLFIKLRKAKKEA